MNRIDLLAIVAALLYAGRPISMKQAADEADELVTLVTQDEMERRR